MLLLVAWKCAKRIRGNVRINKISTSNRRFIRQVKRLKNGVDRFVDPLPCEIDNHADTTCFGKNFRVIQLTSEVCTVSPYLSEYESLSDIPICTAATAVDLDSGETIILEFGQGLWFGERMEHSLINPNQCRSFGIRVCDDPTDGNRKLGMELSDDYVVPFTMRGTTCNFLSRSPTLSELETCKRFGFPIQTNGIRRKIFSTYRPSNGDKCVRLIRLTCIRMICSCMILTQYSPARSTPSPRSEPRNVTTGLMQSYYPSSGESV